MRTHTRLEKIILIFIASLFTISCGPRLNPRVQVPPEYTDSEAYRQPYIAFWWNCVIVKSIDLTAACPSTCSATPAAGTACSAGAFDARNQIAELEKKYGPERTREILSLRIGDEDGHSHITPYFPYGPTPEKVRD